MKPYFYIYRADQSRAPKVKHATLAEAQAEAERLANQHPGSTFEILQCVAITRCTQANTFWMDGEQPQEKPRYQYFLDTSNINRRHELYCREQNGIREWANITFPEWQRIDQSANPSRRAIYSSELPPEIKP